MNESSNDNSEYQQLSDQQFHEIDALCDRFEQELANESAPRIETFLEEAPENIFNQLLAELLSIELEYFVKQGNPQPLDDYCQRFPQHKGLVVGVFAGQKKNTMAGDVTIGQDITIDFQFDDFRPELENFQLLEIIGQGGMGVVWRADQTHPVKRKVAIKLINSDMSSKEVLARFDAEKQALALMDHPNIAKVLDAGTSGDDRPYFVMELVEGVPLTQFCDDNKLTVDQRLDLFVSVCKAVQHAHQKGIIHRDLKPSNVLVTKVDGKAIPKVIDFGLAKAVERETKLSDQDILTEFGKVVGTVQYMSPEQAALDCQDIDTRTDVYSLGVILYELLTGSTPLEKERLGNDALLKILEMIREENPPRPSNRLSSSAHSVNSAVSDLRGVQPARLQRLLQGELDWVVMKALEKDRGRRYQTAYDFATDVSNFLKGEMVVARPPSTWYQLKKFARRNRGLVAAFIAVAAALLLGMAGTTYGLFRANQKSKLAERKKNEAIEAKKLATAESIRARDMEAYSTFQLAIARFDDGRAVEGRTLLHQIPQEYRNNFEWHYCNRRFQGSHITCYGHLEGLFAVAFLPDGVRAISAGWDSTLRIWNTTTGDELRQIEGHEGPVLCLAVSPDGSQVVTAGVNKRVYLWDTQSGDLIHQMEGHTGQVNCVVFSPGGDRIVSASNDKTLRAWDTKSGKQIFTISGHTAAAKGVAYSPTGKQLASVGENGRIRIWDAESGELIKEHRQHRLEVSCVAFSPDGTRLIACSYNTGLLWKTDDWQFVAEIRMHNGTHVQDVSFSPDGIQFATGGNDGSIQLWETNSGRKIRSLGSSIHIGCDQGIAPWSQP